MGLTTNPSDPELNQIEPSGMQKSYLVLSDEERAKGFVRPVRLSYKHVGIAGPEFQLRDVSDEERERYQRFGYIKFEPYPQGHKGSCTGRYWTQEHLDKIGKGCGTVTTMSHAIAETYARDPSFYGGTFAAAVARICQWAKAANLFGLTAERGSEHDTRRSD